jgi:hypothetical protein
VVATRRRLCTELGLIVTARKLTATTLERGLLTRNFFPAVAKRGDEFPPCFTSRQFTPALASRLLQINSYRQDGYGVIKTQVTRYDLAPRNMEVIHPKAFASIARHLKGSWKDWEPILGNDASLIRVRKHDDGRVFSMNTFGDTSSLFSPGMRFQAKVDITNFYGSIYTHSIAWAAHGVADAKAKRNQSGDWANTLDKYLREARRRETVGISIGPGTSAVAGEIILSSVDAELKAKGFKFYRYIDDYVFTGETRDEVEAFITAATQELSVYRLSVHPGKTTITELPTPDTVKWVRQLRMSLRGTVSVANVLDALDEALELIEADAEGGVLKYVMVAIEDMLDELILVDDTLDVLVDRLLHIAFARPAIIGSICRIMLEMGSSTVSAHVRDLNRMIVAHATAFRSDAVSWLLYTLISAGHTPDLDAITAVVDSRDCLSMAVLMNDASGATAVEVFVQTIEADGAVDYERDEYWLLYYSFALTGRRWSTVPSAYYDELQPLMQAKLKFVDMAALNAFTSMRSNDSFAMDPRGSVPLKVPY